MSGESRVLAVIPARYGSKRFEGKPLALLKGRPIVVRVVEQARKCKLVQDVVVATDDERIISEVEKAGFRAVMTSREHLSGTDRIAEVAEKSSADIIVNIQGDEPLINPADVDNAVKALLDDPSLNVSTLALPVTSREEFENPNVVKVVTDKNGMALYFSRAPIPYSRDGNKRSPMMKHLGLYVFRRRFLLQYAALEPSGLEMTEKLEQLRILQNGFRIKVVIAVRDSIGIDAPEDILKAEAFLDV